LNTGGSVAPAATARLCVKNQILEMTVGHDHQYSNGTITVRMPDTETQHAARGRAGFTLIELLLFSAIFTLIIGAFIAILVSMVTIEAQQTASSQLTQQGQFLIQQLQYSIESARLVDMPQDVATGTLTLRESTSSADPTTFTLSGGIVYLQQGSTGSLQPITSNRVAVTNLSFTRHYNLNSSSSAFGTDSVSYSFTVSASSTDQGQSAQTFQSSASVLAPVPKIVLIQQAKAENNSGSVSSLAKAFSSNNESGDLLIAVVANQGLVTSSISDTAGNTWVQIASTTYPAYSDEIAIYAATNSNAGANTATVAFASGASYASLFLYEYRGASTSTSFDAWGAQAQSDTSSPVSPSVSPTSSVELLLGVDSVGYPTNALPSAGSGYTLETSSTAGNSTQIFAEDQDQYITGLAAAPWNLSLLASSTALIATFH
jgi:type II secretory pathway component PulJ